MSVSFQTNTLKSRRKAIIDGREYTVRQFGNIERLEVMRLQDEASAILDKYPTDAKDEDYKKEDIRAINSKAERASNILVSLFDDGTETQEHSKRLVASLTDEDIVDLIAAVFKQTEPKAEDEDKKS